MGPWAYMGYLLNMHASKVLQLEINLLHHQLNG